MFYSEPMENRIRFGDVLIGFISTATNIIKPIEKDVNINDPFKIDVHLPQYCVVMDPCCHIGEETILLTPLIRIPDHFLDSPYIVEDINRINNEGVHDKGFMHPEQWNNLSDEKKQEALNAKKQYGLKNYYVYSKHDQLQLYEITRPCQYKELTHPVTNLPKFNKINKPLVFKIGYYAIDFKKIYRVNCEGIHKKTIEKDILASKRLELSIETRNSLRRKMAQYFGDVPEEDKIDDS